MSRLRESAFLAWCVAVAGCRPAPPAGPLVILISGDTAGWIVPCGCTSNQSGGLPRRATYLDSVRSEAEVIVADVGGAPGGKSAYDRLKFEAILQGERAMAIDAHNVGAAEAALGADYLRDVAHRLGTAWISANVFGPGGEPVAEPVRIVAKAGRRVALVGVLSPRYAAAGLAIAAPREAVLDALRRIAGQYDAAVVLAYLPEEELRALAEGLPEVDVVVGGPTGQSLAPQQNGPTLLLSATRQGKFLARLDAASQGASPRWRGKIVELTDRLADDAQQVANVARFRAELGKRDFAPAETSFASLLPPELPEGFAVAGNASCAKCHEKDCVAWRDSRHARAWESLQKQGAHVDPDCQRCHTTGYGLPQGFLAVGKSPNRTQVGCESCHGPSQGHVRNPKMRTGCFAEAKNHCAGCHDHENSPKFAYDVYWPKIAHGVPAANVGDSK